MRLYGFTGPHFALASTFGLATILLSSSAIDANAQSYARACIETARAAEAKGSQPLGIQAPEAEQIIRDVARSIGLFAEIKIYPCRFGKVEALYVGPSDQELTEGEYITYNPDWIREVIGSDRVQLLAVLGHELGHFLNRHFTTNKSLSLEAKETQADQFAGCAVARARGDWKNLEHLLSRLRREQDERYPNRLKSLDAAFEGFRACGGASKPEMVTQLRNSPEAFCENLNILLELSDDGFIQLRGELSSHNLWDASFTLPGYGRCSIRQAKSSTYSCFGSHTTAISVQRRDRDKTVRKIQKCLGPQWRKQDFNENFVSISNSALDRSVSVHVGELPAFTSSDNKPRYYSSIGVTGRYNVSARSKSNKDVNVSYDAGDLAKAEVPKNYCSTLKEVVSQAESGFGQIAGLRNERSARSRLQVEGWQDCRIYNLDSDRNTSFRTYHSCTLSRVFDVRSAAAFIAAMTADLKQCLVGSWSYRTRTSLSGTPVGEATSVDTGTEVELRMVEDDDLWRVKLDVNQFKSSR